MNFILRNKKAMILLIAFIIFSSFIISYVPTFAQDLVIALDAGHGGNDSGATSKFDGKVYYEKDINRKIVDSVEKYLSVYKGIKTIMVREGDEYLTQGQRVSKANRLGAQVFVSVHNNSSDNETASGSLVCAANSKYRPNLTQATIDLGETILESLNEIGLRNRGLYQPMANTATYKATYPDGSLQDYYGIVMRSIRAGFPGIIVECAFMSCEDDMKNYLTVDEKLDEIGKQIALGIAEYYNLSTETPYVAEERIGVDARSLTFNEEHIVNLLYPLENSVITSTGSSAEISKENGNPKCYLDYMGMTVQCADYKYVKLSLYSNSNAKLKMYIGWNEVIEPEDQYSYEIYLKNGENTFTLDLSGLPDFEKGFNFIQFELTGSDSFEISKIDFTNEKENSNLKAGETAKSTPEPTETPTETPTITPEPTETNTPMPTNTQEPTLTPAPSVSPSEEPLPTQTEKPTDESCSTPEKTDKPTSAIKLSSEGIIMVIIIGAIIILLIILVIFSRSKKR